MAIVRSLATGKPQNGTNWVLGIGGAESNVAVGLARLGNSVRWVSALGQDAFGDLV